MSMTYIYRSPTTPAGAGWTEDLGNQAVRLGDVQGLIMEAELGSVGISSLRFDDPTGTAGHAGDAIVGLKQFTVNELAADLNNRRIFEGYIGDRRYYRGTESSSPSLRTQAARVIDMTLVDINSFLSFRVFRNGSNTSFNRPAETDVERVTALLDTDQLSGTLFDNGLFSTASPVDMDAVDYTGQRPSDVLNDCAQQSGKNFFVYYDEVANQFSLFYDFNDSLVYPAYDPDLKVSNVLADVDFTAHKQTGPVWAPLIDAVLVRDPSRVVAGCFIANGSNSVYETQISTSYTYGFRDAVGNSANLKTAAQARARALRYLSENSTEDDRITFTLKLPAANVNDWKEGQYAPVKFSHLPGYEDYVNCRCLVRTVSQDEQTDEFYNVKYEVCPMASSPSGAFDMQVAGVSFSGIPTLPRPTTPGNVLFMLVFANGQTAGNFPTEIRMLDNPPTTGSPPVPPYSPAQSAAWTVIATATTDYTGQNIGGPDDFQGLLVGAAWRYVQPGEVTTNPVAVSTEISGTPMTSVYLWELPTTVAPSGSFQTGNGHEGIPCTPSLTSLSGNVVAAFQYPLAGGHSTSYSGGNPVAASATTGTLLRQAWVTGFTGDLNKDDLTTPNTMNWGQIILLPTGGAAAASVLPGINIPGPGTGYTSLNWCGIAVELPAGVTLPDIPYPANQSA